MNRMNRKKSSRLHEILCLEGIRQGACPPLTQRTLVPTYNTITQLHTHTYRYMYTLWWLDNIETKDTEEKLSLREYPVDQGCVSPDGS